MRADVSALILAGGRASRLGGIDKSALVVEGASILERQRAVLAPRVAEVLVAGPRAVPGARVVPDAAPDAGPLGGIAGGLAAATTPWLLVVAGDMPYLHGPLVDLLLAAARPGWDAVAPRVGGLPEPLCCVLGEGARAAVARRLASGRRRASAVLTEEGLRVAWLEEEALRAVDPTLRGLHNVNTAADLP